MLVRLRAKSPECRTRTSGGMTFLFIQEAFIKHLLRIVHNWKGMPANSEPEASAALGR